MVLERRKKPVAKNRFVGLHQKNVLGWNQPLWNPPTDPMLTKKIHESPTPWRPPRKKTQQALGNIRKEGLPNQECQQENPPSEGGGVFCWLKFALKKKKTKCPQLGVVLVPKHSRNTPWCPSAGLHWSGTPPNVGARRKGVCSMGPPVPTWGSDPYKMCCFWENHWHNTGGWTDRSRTQQSGLNRVPPSGPKKKNTNPTRGSKKKPRKYHENSSGQGQPKNPHFSPKEMFRPNVGNPGPKPWKQGDGHNVGSTDPGRRGVF